MKYRKTNIVLLLAAVLTACETTISEPAEDYFPVNTGVTAEYEVKETRYSVTEAPLELTWYLKEVVGEPLDEINGFSVYKLERYRKNLPGDAWKIDSVWTIYRQPDKVVKTENNTPYIKLRLPASDGLSWNGNALNTLNEQTYRLKTGADGQAEVVQMADSSLVHLNKSIEKYQAGKGLIYKEVRVYNYCQSSPDCIGKNIITSGFDMVYRAL